MADDLHPQLIEYGAKDGARAVMRVFRAQDAASPVLVCLPAMGAKASYYTEFALALRAAGFHAVMTDLRGIDSSSVRASRACDFGYEEILTLDLPALVDKVRECFPRNSRMLVSHSLGGQLCALYLSAHPDAAEGLILIAACNVHYKGWQGAMCCRVLGTVLMFRALGAVLGYVPAAKFGFAGNEARTVVRDWSNNCLTGRYVIANSNHDYERSLRQMTTPVLAMSFELDKLAPRRAVDNLVRKLGRSAVTRRHFAQDHPGLEKATHFNWVKRPEVIVQAVKGWLKNEMALTCPGIFGPFRS